jgi:hypothetical protein
MEPFSLDVAHLLAGLMVLVSLMLLYQDRMFGLINVFALHAVVLSLSVGWQAFIQHAPHLYITAGIALVLKALIIPAALHRMVVRLGIHRTIEAVGGIGLTMLVGMGLVALSMVVMLGATSGADPQRPHSRRCRRQRHAARRRDQRRLLGACRLHRHRRVPLPHSRALRRRGHRGAAGIPG